MLSSLLFIAPFCFTCLCSSSLFLCPRHLLCLFQVQIKIQMLTLSVFACLFWAFLAILTSQYAFFPFIVLETKRLGEFTCPYGNRGTQGVRIRRLWVVWKKKKIITGIEKPLRMLRSEMLISVLLILPSHQFSHSAASCINPIPTAFSYVMSEDSMPENLSTLWICISWWGDFHHYELRKKKITSARDNTQSCTESIPRVRTATCKLYMVAKILYHAASMCKTVFSCKPWLNPFLTLLSNFITRLLTTATCFSFLFSTFLQLLRQHSLILYLIPDYSTQHT